MTDPGPLLDPRLLGEGAARFGVTLSADQQDKLAAFAAMIRRWNAVMNLVSRDDVARLEIRHLLDSLAFTPHLRGVRVADLGTGAGLPGLPLAIVRADVAFSLIDRSEKRAGFVQQTVFELGLANVEVLTVDLGRFRPSPGFDTVVARALAQPGKTWRYARGMLVPGGRAVLAAAEAAPAPLDTDIVVASFPVELPGIEHRHRLMVVDLINEQTKSAEQV